MTTALSQEHNSQYIAQFKGLIEAGISKFEEAARVFVAAIDKDPDARTEFERQCPGIPPSAWSGFEAVGRGWMDKRVLWLSGNASTKLKFLPKSQQTSALDNGVPVLASDGSELLIKVEHLSREQVKMVFAADHIRSLPEQRAWQENNNAKTPPKAKPVYEIRQGKLQVFEPATFDRKTLARIMWELER